MKIKSNIFERLAHLATRQLVINTGTTIIPFLMVFLIQRMQNKDSMALHLKLNELVAVLKGPVTG